VILTLGPHEVRRSAFETHLKSLESRGGAPLGPEVRGALLQSFVEEQVLVLAAREKGLLGPAPQTPEAEQAAVQRLLAGEALRGAAITREQALQHFQDHQDRYRVAETVTLRQILVGTENEAREVVRRLRADPKEFEALARALSRSPEASSGGLMGTFGRGQLPTELEATAFSLPAGGTSEPIKTAFGYHILRAEARSAARAPSFEEVLPRVQAELSREKSEAAVKQYVAGLLARAKVNHEAAQAVPSA
jgi:parvulin-like peptidyl-prolyl isomerase